MSLLTRSIKVQAAAGTVAAVLVCNLLAGSCASGEASDPIGSASSAAPKGDLPTTIASAVAERLIDVPDLRDIRAVLVVQDGTTLFEKYYGATAEDYQDTASVTKSVMSALIGIAIEEGYIAGVDATLGDLLPAYRDQMTPAVAAATLEQLLTMTAGFGNFCFSADSTAILAEDSVAAILAAPEQPPGTEFGYSNAGVHLLTAILEQATGRDVLDYARARLFDPLGIDSRPATQPVDFAPGTFAALLKADFAWPTDKAGRNTGFGGLWLRPADMAKFGQLYLDDGVWNGKQLVPADWVKTSTSAHEPTPFCGAEASYGYLWWVGELDGDPTYLAWGAGGQVIRVIPSRRLVIVLSVGFPKPDSRGAKFESALFLADSVIAGLFKP